MLRVACIDPFSHLVTNLTIHGLAWLANLRLIDAEGFLPLNSLPLLARRLCLFYYGNFVPEFYQLAQVLVKCLLRETYMQFLAITHPVEV